MGKNKAENETERLGGYCIHCESPSSFFLYRSDHFDLRGVPYVYRFASCDRCSGPAVFWAEHAEGYDEEDLALHRVFPRHRASLACALPKIAEQSFNEAMRCEEAKAWLAAVVMVGRTLEAVCQEHFSQEKGLTIFKGIELLFKEGLISEQLKSWADELRILRNIGAHATDVDVDEKDAKEAIDFLRAILENLYDLTPKFESFKARRAIAK